MGVITAKQLKQKTGEVIKRIKSGERLTLTYRGKPVAVIVPSTSKEKRHLAKLRPVEEAWRDIEASLQRTQPAFKGWEEAIAWVRS